LNALFFIYIEVFQGGSSRAARDMSARVSDWYFTNGNSVEEIKKQIDDVRNKARLVNRQVKIGVNAFIIARDTEEEAKTVLNEIIAQANQNLGINKQIEQAEVLPSAAVPDLDAAESRLHPKPTKNLTHVA
jgi:alkanesulfonate monooxygenase SsuD/methylene tetrahydromethanopterin reductase-like flavin-dependent oxidoreductase (luciferase family)